MRCLSVSAQVSCVVLIAVCAAAAPSSSEKLDQTAVFARLSQNLQALMDRIPADQPGHEDLVSAQGALTSIKTAQTNSGHPLSQQSLQSLDDLDHSLQTVSAQVEIKKGEIAQLQAVSYDLRVKNDHCLTMWQAGGGLTEVPVIVRTTDPDHPQQDVAGCQVACVSACFYGTPDQEAHTHWFAQPGSPTRDRLTPGLYYWWTKRGESVLTPAVKHEVSFTQASQTSVMLSLPAPP